MLEAVPLIITVIFSFVIKNVFGSTGDRSQMFYRCVQECLANNCSGKTKTFSVCARQFCLYHSQPLIKNLGSAQDFQLSLPLRLLQWTCSDECKYMCMWPTVNWFVEAEIGVQQFYGKVWSIYMHIISCATKLYFYFPYSGLLLDSWVFKNLQLHYFRFST